MTKKELKEYMATMNYAELKGYYLEQLRLLESEKEQVKRYCKNLYEADTDSKEFNYHLDDIDYLVICKREIKYYNDIIPTIKKELDKKEKNQITVEEYNNYVERNKVNLDTLFKAIEEKRQEFYNDPFVFKGKDKKIELSKREIDNIIECLTMETISIIKDRIGDVVKVNRLEFNSNRGFDGVIEGSKYIIYINTIIAGGYNVQKLHYRTLSQIDRKWSEEEIEDNNN